jgi:hypothetical protein
MPLLVDVAQLLWTVHLEEVFASRQRLEALGVQVADFDLYAHVVQGLNSGVFQRCVHAAGLRVGVNDQGVHGTG